MVYCGIDEAGRGPLAGPVTAVATVLHRRSPIQLYDSKAITEIKRKKTVHLLRHIGVVWGSGWASPKEIDAINIRQATLLAMQRAYHRLVYKLSISKNIQPTHALVDGKDIPSLPIPTLAIIKGDTMLPEIQAASILAKHARDLIMRKLALHFPQYAFEQHKGYPTPAHAQKIQSFGLTPIHRKTFRAPPASSQSP